MPASYVSGMLYCRRCRKWLKEVRIGKLGRRYCPCCAAQVAEKPRSPYNYGYAWCRYCQRYVKVEIECRRGRYGYLHAACGRRVRLQPYYPKAKAPRLGVVIGGV